MPATAVPTLAAPSVGVASGGATDCAKELASPEGALVSCVGGWLFDLAADDTAGKILEPATSFLLNLLGVTTDDPRIDEINEKLTDIQNQLTEQRELLATVQESENNIYSVLTELKLQTEQQAIASLVNRVASLQGIESVAGDYQVQYLTRLRDLKNSAPTAKATCVKPAAAGSLAQRCYEAYTDYQNALETFTQAYRSELGSNLALNKDLHDYLVAGKIGSGTVVTSYADYLVTRGNGVLTAAFSDRLAAFYASIHAAEVVAVSLEGTYLAAQRAITLDPVNQVAATKRLHDLLRVEVVGWAKDEVAALPPRIPAGVVVVMDPNQAVRTTTVGQPMFLLPAAATPDPCGTPDAGSGAVDSAWRLRGTSTNGTIDFFNYCKYVPGTTASLADVRTWLARDNDPLARVTATTSSTAKPAPAPLGGGFTDWGMPRLSNPTDGTGYGAGQKVSELNYLFSTARPATLGLPSTATLADVLGQLSDGYSTKTFEVLTTPGTKNRGRLWLRDEFGVTVWYGGSGYTQSGTKAANGSFGATCTISGAGYNGGTYTCAGPAGSPAHDWLETRWPTTDNLVANRRQDSGFVLRFPDPVCTTGPAPCIAELALRTSSQGAVTLATRRTNLDYLKPLSAQGHLCNGILFDEGATTALKGANLSGCNLRGLDLRGADLTKANLTRADLTGTSLGGAVLTGVTWDDAICPNGIPNPKQYPNLELPCSTALTAPRTAVTTSAGLSSSRLNVTYGRTATFLSGALVDAGSDPLAGRTVRLFGHRVGVRAWSLLGSVVTSRWGTYSYVVTPSASWVYQVRFPAVVGAYAGSSSRAVTLNVAYRVTTSLKSSVQRTTLAGSVSPDARGRFVILQRRVGAAWVDVTSVRVGRNGTFAFRVPRGVTSSLYRVRKPASSPWVAGWSRATRI